MYVCMLMCVCVCVCVCVCMWNRFTRARKTKTAMKLVCVGANEKIVGVHLIGIGVDEILQGIYIYMMCACVYVCV